MKSQKLGRGLDALFGEIDEAYENEGSKREIVLDVAVEKIKPNPFQPRKSFNESSLQELAESIKKDGLLQPIVVKEDIDGYILIAGERRLRASKLAKMETIRAIVDTSSEEKMRQFALIENIQREELNSVELAEAYGELLKLHSMTHEALSLMIHKSRTHITNTLRLLQLSNATKKSLIEQKITTGHAKVLIGLHEKEQEVVLSSIIGQKLSVRDTEKMIKAFKEKKKSRSFDAKKSILQEEYDFTQLRNSLKKYGFKYQIKNNTLSFSFQSENDIEKLLAFFE